MMHLKLLTIAMLCSYSCYAETHEFGVGCQYINGRCYKRCAKGTHGYVSACNPSIPTWSEPTCEQPVVKDLGTICDMSRCDCDPPTIRDTINNKCVLPKDCPAPGSKPTGPPIDDSYLYVEMYPRPPPRRPVRQLIHDEKRAISNRVKKSTPEREFGEGCQYIMGRCYKRCAKGTHSYSSSCSTSHPTWSEMTCEQPLARDMGAICDMSRCDCDLPTIRDTINNKCVLPEDCPAPGSKPTGPPIDDSYLYVELYPRPPPLPSPTAP